MPNRAPSALAQLGLAIGAVAVAIIVRQLLSLWLGTTFPLATMFTAVALVVWRAGWAPALGVAIGGWVAVGFIFRGGLNYFGGLTINEIVGFLYLGTQVGGGSPAARPQVHDLVSVWQG